MTPNLETDKAIILFTQSFPFGEGEQFLETEINYLSSKFKKVFIVPNITTAQLRNLPSNCEVVIINAKFTPTKRLGLYILNNFKTIFSILGYTLLKSTKRKTYLKVLKTHIIQLACEIETAKLYAKELAHYLKQSETLYFYWFVNPFIQFAILKSQNKITHRLISRAHGYDFDEQQGRFPIYREYELKQINEVFTVSKYGLNYLKNKYPKIPFKVSVSYLGTANVVSNSTSNSNVFHIVSCSAFHPVKRINLIVDILRVLDIQVLWTHFGSGEMEQTIHDLAKELPKNIEVNFKGQVSNQTILSFYQLNSIDLFINTSSLEGIPVSIMEAISFGIPVIACNTCGVPEIVTTNTGFLFPINFEPQAIAAKIKMYANTPLSEKLAFRKSVKQFWEANFNAQFNYTNFIKQALLN
jgi:glycosyltransferase involved in cell wall biosynthesis